MKNKIEELLAEEKAELEKLKKKEEDFDYGQEMFEMFDESWDDLFKDFIKSERELSESKAEALILDKALDEACKNGAISNCYEICPEYSDNVCEGGICNRYKNEVKRLYNLFLEHARGIK